MKVVSFPGRMQQVLFCLVCYVIFLTLGAWSHILFPLLLCHWKLSPCQLLVTVSIGRFLSPPIYLLGWSANAPLFVSVKMNSVSKTGLVRLNWQILTVIGQRISIQAVALQIWVKTSILWGMEMCNCRLTGARNPFSRHADSLQQDIWSRTYSIKSI